MRVNTARILLPILLFTLLSIPIYLLTASPSTWVMSMINNVNTCNIFRGKWVPHSREPYYTNATCHLIFDQQNCMKFGRPDTEFLKWRWEPDRCDLPAFDAVRFLELMRGKSMAFVGDSVGRNQAQSLLCLLASVMYPSDITNTTDEKIRFFHYKDYNFTLGAFWSPYLVRTINTEPEGPKYDRLVNVYLDEPNPVWAHKIERFDYVIVSAGHWFFGPQIYYEDHHIVGCHRCPVTYSATNISMFYGYRMAFRTTFKTLLRLRNFNGTVFLRTWSPAHFENGEWNEGGSCPRTSPVKRGVMVLKGDSLRFYSTQLEELRRAEEEANESKRGLKFKVLDTSEAMVVRPDGHPNHYGHWPHENVTIADCVHWCLPGPIDTWNEFLLQMLKMEGL